MASQRRGLSENNKLLGQQDKLDSRREYQSHRLKDRHGCDGGSDAGAKNQKIQEEEEVWAQLDLLVLVHNSSLSQLHNLFQGLHARADRPEDAVEADQSVEEEHPAGDEDDDLVERRRVAGAFVHSPVNVAIHIWIREADSVAGKLPAQESKACKTEDSFNNLKCRSKKVGK